MSRSRAETWPKERKPEVKKVLETSRTRAEAAAKLKVSLSALDWACSIYGLSPQALLQSAAPDVPAEREPEVEILRRKVKALEKELDVARSESLSDEIVRRAILGLADQPLDVPQWMVKTSPASKSPGVPTLLLGDWHWAERVDPTQIGGVNRYDLKIARARAQALVTNTIDLLEHHVVRPEYPGIVVAGAGDMLSGTIHEELTETNEVSMNEALLDLLGVLVWSLETLADHFGHVFVPWVRGNHTRDSRKPRAKGAAFHSYDWLLGQLLARHFAKDDRFRFLIPNGVDALYRVYGHRNLLTHGDHLSKGGDGIIGCLGPLARGEKKRRSRGTQIAMPYDTLLCGHFHTTLWLSRLFSTGSLKGFDELAFRDGYDFEEPQQSLFLTHPRHGVTIKMHVRVEKGEARPESSWVQWAA